MQGWRAGSPAKLSARVIRLNRRNSITPVNRCAPVRTRLDIHRNASPLSYFH
jgi:hypothetical protein